MHPTYEVVALRYGTLRTTRQALFASYGVYGEPDGPMSMDYFFWVVRGAGRTVVVDTGFSPEAGRRRGRETLCSPRDALARLGVHPRSVTHVVLTHFHYDHVGNLGLFPDAELVADSRELAFWTGEYGSRPVPAAPVEAAEVRVLDRERDSGRLRLVEPGQPGASVAPGVELLSLPGHTPGQLAVAVPTATGRVVLASDAAHSYEELERDMPFHIYTDLVGMYRGLQALRGLAAEPGTQVVPGHDPDVMSRFPAVSPETRGVAVLLS